MVTGAPAGAVVTEQGSLFAEDASSCPPPSPPAISVPAPASPPTPTTLSQPRVPPAPFPHATVLHRRRNPGRECCHTTGIDDARLIPHGDRVGVGEHDQAGANMWPSPGWGGTRSWLGRNQMSELGQAGPL